jgi:hypothetical protein
VSAAALAEIWQHGLDRCDRPEHVDLELRADFGKARLFHRADQAIPGVAHQDIDPAQIALGQVDGSANTRLIGQVSEIAANLRRGQRLEHKAIGLASHRARNHVAARQRRLRQRAAEPAGDTGDQPGRHVLAGTVAAHP